MDKTKPFYLREYRTLLEKLLETRCRLLELKAPRSDFEEIDVLLDKLYKYMNDSIEKARQGMGDR